MNRFLPALCIILSVGSTAFSATPQPPRTPENQVFQWAASGENDGWPDGSKSKGTLYLWVPEKAPHIRGLVIMATNVPEHMMAGHPALRRMCEENDLGLVWAVPSFWRFGKAATSPGGDPVDVKLIPGSNAIQVAFLEKLLAQLAEKSGYSEVASVPWIPIGESGHLLMVCGLVNERPDRCIAAICVKNPHNPENFTVPMLWTLGTAQEWGQKAKDIRTEWNSHTGDFQNWSAQRESRNWPLSIVIEPGTGHFACTDAMVDYFAAYISAAVKARLNPDGSLKKVDLDSGFVASLPLDGITNLEITPYKDATSEQRKQAWFFNESLARSAQKLATTNWKADTQLIGFEPDGNCTVSPFSFNSVTEIEVKTDGEFGVRGVLLDKIPDGFVGAGEPLARAAGEPQIDWICGPYAPVGNGRFRVALTRTWKTGAASYLIGWHPGSDTVRPSFQPAALKLVENKEGAPQKIAFDPVAPLRGDSGPVKLFATSDAGLPVSFTVISGPAIVDGDKLVLTQIPTRSKFPVEVVVGAWQWGRASDPKVQTAPMTLQTILIEKP